MFSSTLIFISDLLYCNNLFKKVVYTSAVYFFNYYHSFFQRSCHSYYRSLPTHKQWCINGSFHDLHPAFKGSYLKQSQVSVWNIIKVYKRPQPIASHSLTEPRPGQISKYRVIYTICQIRWPGLSDIRIRVAKVSEVVDVKTEGMISEVVSVASPSVLRCFSRCQNLKIRYKRISICSQKALRWTITSFA